MNPRAIEMQVTDLSVDPSTELPVVILRAIKGDSIFSLTVGALEAKSIRAELTRMSLERPMTHDLINDILDKCGHSIERIEIARCARHEYAATLHLLGECGTRRQVEARPSDALAVAVRGRAPIYVCLELLEQLPDGPASQWKM